MFVNHKSVIPQWDFSIGEGAGIIETFHYYTVGDPLAFLCVFIPTKYMYLYYNFSIVLRLYLSGICFSLLCFYTNKKSDYAILSGSLIYALCFWGLFNAVRHIYFLNPLIYLPLVILGVEKIINKDKPYLFTISVMISALSNFYYFYNIVLLTIIYVVVRLLVLYKKDIKAIFNTVLVLLKNSIIGVLMSAVILLPIIYVFINDQRMGIKFDQHLIYPMIYYFKLPSTLISTSRNFWLCMGSASPVLLALIVSMLKFKKNLLLFILNIIAIIMVVCPICGQIMNGN